MNTLLIELKTIPAYCYKLKPLQLTPLYITTHRTQHNTTNAASHYRSQIPFKAQFISEKVKSTINTDTKERQRIVDAQAHPQRIQSLKPVTSLNTAVTNIPNPKKRQTGGEDSYTVCTNKLTQYNNEYITVLAVYDGVGSWAVDKDINAALFSRALSDATVQCVQQGSIALTPSTILQYIWQTVTEQKIRGGSTACILTHRHHAQQVQCANLGDSGFVVFRPYTVYNEQTHTYNTELGIVFHSTFQWHYFNCPLQLGIDIDYSTDKFDTPESADVFSVQVQVGDIIVLSTDGLFDNIDDSEFINITNKAWNHGQNTSAHISRILADYAFDCSQNKMIDTPFSIMAREENILWRGGRPDDVTVIVATVE